MQTQDYHNVRLEYTGSRLAARKETCLTVSLLFCLFQILAAQSAAAGTCEVIRRLESVNASADQTKWGYLPFKAAPRIYQRAKRDEDYSISELDTFDNQRPGDEHSSSQSETTGTYVAMEAWRVDNQNTGAVMLDNQSGNATWNTWSYYNGALQPAYPTLYSANRTGLGQWNDMNGIVPNWEGWGGFWGYVGKKHEIQWAGENDPDGAYVKQITETKFTRIWSWLYVDTRSDASGVAYSERDWHGKDTVELSEPYSLNDFYVSVVEGLRQQIATPDWAQAQPIARARTRVEPVGVGGSIGSMKLGVSVSKYRVVVLGPKKQKEEIVWVRRFVSMDGRVTPLETNKVTITFTGEIQYLTPEEGTSLEVPLDATGQAQDGWVEIELEGASRDSFASCATGNCRVGEGSVKNGCVHVTMGLGQNAQGLAAGFLFINENTPGPGLLSPQGLKVFASQVEVIRQDGAIRQVASASALVDIVPINNGYEVRYYPPPQNPKVNGLYQPAGQAFSTWKIAGPDASGNAVTVTQTVANGQPQVKGEFTWNAAIQGWEMRHPVSGQLQVRGEVFDGTLKVETIQTKDAAGVVVYQEVRKYRPYPDPLGDTLVELIVGDGAGARTTTWVYYDDPQVGGYGKLRQVIEPGGRWERYEYDQWGRTTKKVSQFLNEPVTAADSASRVAAINYSSETIMVNGVPVPKFKTFAMESLLGVPYSARITTSMSGEVEELVQPPGAASAGQLRTVTKTYAMAGAEGVVESVLSPDGTLQIITTPAWQPGQAMVVTSLQGRPNEEKMDVVDGTRSETHVAGDGRVSGRWTYDIVSGFCIGQETYAYDGDGRLATTAYFDGTSTSTTYGCCGPESTTDREGVQTIYGYDSLGRQISATRNGIATISTYDVAGNVTRTERQGRDASVVLLNTATYDVGGRQLTSTDALNKVTSFSESTDASGRIVRTTTYPDTSTQITLSAQDGSVIQVSGTGTHPVRYEYGIENGKPYTREIKLQADGSDSPEWVKTYTDFAGRPALTKFSDNHLIAPVYDPTTGQLRTETGSRGERLVYYYGARGEVEYAVVVADPLSPTVDPNAAVPFASGHRITKTTTAYVNGQNGSVRRTETHVWTGAQTDVKELAGVTETSLDGRQTWRTVMGAISQTINSPGQSVTQIAPDGSSTLTEYSEGRVVRFQARDARQDTMSWVGYNYDPHDRLQTVTDVVRGTATAYTYDVLDRVLTVTTPAGTAGQPNQVTTYTYDDMGRATQVTLPDTTTVHNTYYLTGELKKTHGSRTYPVEYVYDAQGRLKSMATWRSFASDSGKAVTTWSYDAQRGWMTRKNYSGAPGPGYAYDVFGRVISRTSARGVVTLYDYSLPGDLRGVSYTGDSGLTPAATFAYDRRGRMVTAGNPASAEVRISYNNAGLPLSEELVAPGLPGGGIRLTHSRDVYLRRTATSVMVGTQDAGTAAYAYDDASRLKTVTSGSYTANHSYQPNSRLLRGIDFKAGVASRLNTQHTYDRLNRLTEVSSYSTLGASVSARYEYNAAGQRIRVEQADGSYWQYQYDALGQVKSGKKYLPSGEPLGGQQFEYTFDDIGNRTAAKNGGNQTGTGLRSFSYTPNSLNQYTSRTVPDAVDILGTAPIGSPVTVNGQAAVRQANYFWREVPVPGADLRVLSTTIGNTVGTATTTKTGWLVVPPATETYHYDLDGNLTQDGHWNYTWDGENRLVRMQARAGTPAQADQRLEFSYDVFGRRIEKRVYDSGGNLTSQRKFVYDGWNVVAVLDGANALLQSYVWGNDLSGSRQGAGGVGGLLLVKDYQPATQGAYCYCYDGNGNVTALVNADNGAVAARYEYGPFGELLRATGPMALVNPFRFSTKWQDEETGFLYYGYRYYDPTAGRWASRDPIEENGGLNLNGFVQNSPMSFVDVAGLVGWAVNPPQAYWDPKVREMVQSRDFQEGVKQGAAKAAVEAFWLFVPNPKGTWEDGNTAVGEAFNPELPASMRAAAAAAGVSIVILGVVEVVPGSKLVTTPLKKEACKVTKGVLFKAKRAPKPGGGGTTRLYRAVEPGELGDVLKYGDYNIHPNSTFKRFAFDPSSLDDFIKANPGRDYTKTFIDVPTENLGQMYRHADPGGVGKSIGIDVYENPHFYDWFDKVHIIGK